jgi:hypothetical protein
MKNVTGTEQLKFTHLPVIAVTAVNICDAKATIPIRDQAVRLAIGCITHGLIVHQNGHTWRGQRTTWPNGVTALSYGGQSSWGEIRGEQLVPTTKPMPEPQPQPATRSDIPTAIALAVLLLAVVFGHWPYGFYMLLRLIVCGCSIYLALRTNNTRNRAWTWILGGMAVLFNPIVPIHMDRSDWQIVDLIASITLLVFGIFYKPRSHPPL